MAQILVYGRDDFLRSSHAQLSDVIHGAAQRTLALPADKRFHRFIPLEAWQLVAPADRSARYLIVEVHLFTGRSLDTRKALVRALMDDLAQAFSLSPADVEVTLFESPREHWGIRGQHGDELALSYRVET